MNSTLRTASFLIMAGCVNAAFANPQPSAQASASPVLTWNRIALEAVERSKPTQHQVVRLLAHLSLAQHVVAAEASSEDAAREGVATASMRVIASMLPGQAAYAQERHRALQSQENERGAKIAERVLAEAERDGFAQKWTGQPPQASYAWRSLVNPPAPPAYPAIGSMRMFFAEAGNAFRSDPPPAMGSARFAEDLAEVRRVTTAPTAESIRIAKFYDMTTGTLAGGFWNERAVDLIRSSRVNTQRATTILATLNGAMMDALVACHETKYTYWVPRPSQADPTIKTIIGVPNHPAYPSNHSCLSTAAAQVLAHFFPNDRAKLDGISKEAGVSRIYAGLHYRFDVDAGEAIGRKVAAAAVARHLDLLARWTRTLVGGF